MRLTSFFINGDSLVFRHCKRVHPRKREITGDTIDTHAFANWLLGWCRFWTLVCSLEIPSAPYEKVNVVIGLRRRLHAGTVGLVESTLSARH